MWMDVMYRPLTHLDLPPATQITSSAWLTVVNHRLDQFLSFSAEVCMPSFSSPTYELDRLCWGIAVL